MDANGIEAVLTGDPGAVGGVEGDVASGGSQVEGIDVEGEVERLKNLAGGGINAEQLIVLLVGGPEVVVIVERSPEEEAIGERDPLAGQRVGRIQGPED